MTKSFSDLFENKYSSTNLEGKIVSGKVIEIGSGYAILDVGLKSHGRVNLSEFPNEELVIGQTIDLYVDSYEGRHGYVILSREKAIKETNWTELEKAYEAWTPIAGTVVGKTKGGYSVDVNGIIAFMPSNQAEKSGGVTPGTSYDVFITKLNKNKGNVVVTKKTSENQQRCRLENIKEGDILDGTVRTITNYGMFVGIGETDGLVHNSDIFWKRVPTDLSSIYTLGQNVKVKVLKINKTNNKVSLGIKQLEEDPWGSLKDKYPAGTVVNCKITNITDYGLFVSIEDGLVEGMVYIADVDWDKKPKSLKSSFSIGQEIKTMVLNVDHNRRSLSLGIKQLTDNPLVSFIETNPIGSEIKGIVSEILDFGLIITFGDKNDGMLHCNEISWEESGRNALKNYKIGDEVKVKIIDVDFNRNNLSLGVKQLTEDPYKKTMNSLRSGNVVECTVSVIHEEGINVKLESGAVGFIKKIDMGKGKSDRIKDRFKVGDVIQAKIISFDPHSKKLNLSVRAIEVENDRRLVSEYAHTGSGVSFGDILSAAKKDKA